LCRQRAGRALASAGVIDQVAAGFHQFVQQAEDRAEISGLFFRSGAQAVGHLDRVGHGAVELRFLVWSRQRGICLDKGDQASGADGPADRLADLVGDDPLNGLVG